MAKLRTQTDVVVVGGGGAGLAAASEAARLGRSVILLEKNPALGGSTAWSVGSLTASNTPHQRRLGIRDTPREHFADLALLAGPLAPRDNLALRRLLVDNTSDMMDWLMGLGMEFIGPMPEPPHRYPRMHNVLPNAGAFIYHLARHCRRLGVRIETGAQAGRLLSENGRVVGVAVRDGAQGERHVLARCGVVLASGDYSADRALKERYAPPVVEVEAVNATATGDGHRMALELGASIVNGDLVRGPILRFIPPTRRKLILALPPWRLLTRCMRWSVEHLPDRLLRPFMMSFLTTALGPSPDLFAQGALLVNRAGERFTEETGRPASDVTGQPGGVAYLLFDQDLADKFQAWPHFISTAPGIAYAYLKDYQRNRKDIYHRGRSLEALAASLEAPPDALARTLAAYNGTDASRAGRPALTRAPFHALGPVKSYVVFTDGGLKVTESLEVVGRDDAPIPGLFAAGSAGQGGLLLEGHGHHLGWAFISGRLAGRQAAYNVPPD